MANAVRGRFSADEVLRYYIRGLAAFALLRNADIEEGERLAIAEFDGHDYLPQIPSEINWAAISSVGSDRLITFLKQTVWPALDALKPSGVGAMLRRIPSVFDLDRIPGEIAVSARDLVAQTWTHAAIRDVLASEFEETLRTWVEQTRFSGEFATPPALADLMVELVAPRVGARVYDPCFGTGGLLVRAARR